MLLENDLAGIENSFTGSGLTLSEVQSRHDTYSRSILVICPQ